MNRLKDKKWLAEKSNYSVGFGVGTMLSALYLSAGSTNFTKYWVWGIGGAVITIIGGVLGSVERRK
jgi:hypothetical protein